MLSGYLITTLLMEEHRNGGIEIGRFYARRALRLYPTLLLLLVTYLALAPVLWPSDDRWLIAALSGFYLMDYGLAFWDLPTSIGHTWSLGVEEKFYLLLALTVATPPASSTSDPVADRSVRHRYRVALLRGKHVGLEAGLLQLRHAHERHPARSDRRAGAARDLATHGHDREHRIGRLRTSLRHSCRRCRRVIPWRV